ALWCRYCYGETDSGAVIEPNDPSWDRLTAQSKLAKSDPKVWLAMTDIYGDLGPNPTFITAFSHALTTLWDIGTKATLERYLADRL
ncbi:MAG: mannitol dehydrogenase family protein, partial [Devosia sp.]|nr:mannitol dehydrogenase family protein [Devosia sp.]